MKKLTLPGIHNIHKSKPAFVIGHSATLNTHLDKLKELVHEKGKYVFISCNEADKIEGLELDYWVISSTMYTINNVYEKLNGKNSVVVYADSVDMTPRNDVKNLLNNNYLPYDQRHFNGLPCYDKVIPCCNHLIKNRLTIQEYLQKITKYKSHYSTGDTVALHMMALAVILGCNPIYIVGVDIDYSIGYVNSDIKNDDSFDPHYDNIMNDFWIIDQSAKNIGVKMINLNKNSKFNVFKIGELNVS